MSCEQACWWKRSCNHFSKPSRNWAAVILQHSLLNRLLLCNKQQLSHTIGEELRRPNANAWSWHIMGTCRGGSKRHTLKKDHLLNSFLKSGCTKSAWSWQRRLKRISSLLMTTWWTLPNQAWIVLVGKDITECRRTSKTWGDISRSSRKLLVSFQIVCTKKDTTHQTNSSQESANAQTTSAQNRCCQVKR